MELREQGASLATIARKVGVAKSTVSRWVRHVELDPELQQALRAADPVLTHQRLGQAAWSEACRERRLAAQEDGRRRARLGDWLHQAGCMLYWAEGGKRSTRMDFTNSDVHMVRLFLRFLRECYEVPESRLRLTINCFLGNGPSLEQIEDWWLEQLELPRSVLRPSVVNRPSRRSKSVRRVLVYGTARITVCSTELKQSILGAIQEYAGFEREDWLASGRSRRPAPARAS